MENRVKLRARLCTIFRRNSTQTLLDTCLRYEYTPTREHNVEESNVTDNVSDWGPPRVATA